MDQDVITVPVDLEDSSLVAALSADLPFEEKRTRVRTVLARMGASPLDLRDAQRGIVRRRMSPQRLAEYEAGNAQAQYEAARLFGH